MFIWLRKPFTWYSTDDQIEFKTHWVWPCHAFDTSGKRYIFPDCNDVFSLPIYLIIATIRMFAFLFLLYNENITVENQCGSVCRVGTGCRHSLFVLLQSIQILFVVLIFGLHVLGGGRKHVIRLQIIEIHIDALIGRFQFGHNVRKVRPILWILCPTLLHQLVQMFRTIFRSLHPLSRAQIRQQLMIANRWIWEAT